MSRKPGSRERHGRRTGARGTRGTTGIFSTRDPPTEEEVKFLEAAEYGNIPTVRKMLEDLKTLNVNCVDFMGQNALQLAVGNEHLEVVELLLKQPSMARIGDALLLAISKGYVRIAEIILNHHSFQVHDRLARSICEQRLLNQDILQRVTVPLYCASQAEHKMLCEDTDFYAYDEDGTRFSPDITPIILAAQCQEYEIVHALLIRGAKIERPHNYQCTCEECTFRKKLDSFSYSLSRINAYKGLASPAYLSLSSKDPVYTALELSHELQQLADVEKEFKKEYHDLAAQCDDFAERLLDLCHDTEEVEIILNGEEKPSLAKDSWEKEKSPEEPLCDYAASKEPKELPSVTEQSPTRTSFPNNNSSTNFSTYRSTISTRNSGMPQLARLKTAIRYSVKRFVAHPNCQQQLLRLWQTNLDWLWQSPFYCKLLFAVAVMIFMPFLSLLYIFAPCSKISAVMKSPFFKFVSQAVSYFQFLCLLVVNTSDRFEGEIVPSWFLVHQTKPEGRFTVFTWCEIAIMLYVIGFLWNECHEVFDEGPREYMFKLWNIIDFFMLSIFFASYALRAISYSRVNQAQNWWDDKYGENITKVHYDFENKTLYVGNEIRDDIIPDSMGYYAYNNAERRFWAGTDPQILSEALFSFGIVLSFSRIAYLLPANEMFGQLQISLGRTIADIVKWLVIFSMIFGAFLLGLFNLYSYYVIDGAKSSKAFTTIEETFITLFWSMFGLADYKGVEVNYAHPFTRLVGYQLYGAYNIISVIIMLNMLIAMLNSSYSDVEKDADVEWKFARAKLWLSYFDDGKTLPVPYNIIPSVKSFRNVALKLSLFFRNIGERRCFKRRRSACPPEFGKATRRKRPSLKESVSLSSFGVSATINKKQNGLRRSETVSETGRREGHGYSTRGKNEQLNRYQKIMRRIVKRFVIRAQAEKDRDEVNEGELQEIKHDISSLRFELLENNASYAEQIARIRSLLEGCPLFLQARQETVHDKKESEKKKACPRKEVTLQRKKLVKSASVEEDESPKKEIRAKRTGHTLWATPRQRIIGRGRSNIEADVTEAPEPVFADELSSEDIETGSSGRWDENYDEVRPLTAAKLGTIHEKLDAAPDDGRRRKSAFNASMARKPSPRPAER